MPQCHIKIDLLKKSEIIKLIGILIILLNCKSVLAQNHIILNANTGMGVVAYNPKTESELTPFNIHFNFSWSPFTFDFLSTGPFLGFQFRLPNSWDSFEDEETFEGSIEPGWFVYYRKSLNYALTANLVIPIIYSPYVASGAGINAGIVYFLTTGLGLSFQLNSYWYYGVESVVVFGWRAGILIDYEYWR